MCDAGNESHRYIGLADSLKGLSMATVTRAVLTLFLLAACSRRTAQHISPPTSDPSRPPGTVLTADDIQRSPGQSLEQLLLARVPGLMLTRAPDGHAVLHLRGTTTLLGDEEPLFVVNGIPLGPNAAGNLSAIDPHDIETVQVLRDAASTAAFGMRGANGVILIRTKQN
jgi:TonB-dependent SusC/RagA subfamily outer membrane receptor